MRFPRTNKGNDSDQPAYTGRWNIWEHNMRAGGGSSKALRSIKKITLVLMRDKDALYSIFNRALRDEPGLQGRAVPDLNIGSDGNVTLCRTVTSELKTPEPEAKPRARMRQFPHGCE